MTHKQRLATVTVGLMLFQSACAFAEDYTDNTGTINLDSFQVTGQGIQTKGTTITITEGGDFTVTGSAAEGMIYVDTEDKVKLRLSGMSLSNDDGPAIYFQNTEKALITVTEGTENYLEDGATYHDQEAKAALFSNDDIEIKGNGTLTITGNYKHGIAGDDDIKIENAVLNITSVSDGIHANNTFHMTGGTINVAAGSDGIQAEEDMIIDGGIILISECEEGLESGTTMTFNGGTVDITSSDDGLNSGGGLGLSQPFGQKGGMGGGWNGQQPPMPPEISENSQPFEQGNQPFEQGNRPLEQDKIKQEKMKNPSQMPEQDRPMPQASETEQSRPDQIGEPAPDTIAETGEQTQTDRSIYINGGVIRINAQGDGVDSNDQIYMTGGELYVDGPTSGGDGAIDGSSFNVSGGTVIAVGSNQMSMGLSQTSAQCGFLVSFPTQAAGSELTLTDQEGNKLTSYTPKKEYSSLVYSSDALQIGNTYSLLVNGSSVATVELTQSQVSTGDRTGFGGGRGEMGMQGGKKPQAQKPNTGDRVRVTLNGKELAFDSQPVIQNDTTLVPLRAIFEALGMEVTWDEATSTVTAVKDGITVILTIGSTCAYQNGRQIQLLTAPIISAQNRTLVPVRFIAESLGLTVSWQEEAQTVSIQE